MSITIPQKILGFLLDLCFPKTETILSVERMSVRDFFSITKPPPPLSHPALYACRAYKHALVKESVLEMKYKKNPLIIRLCAEIMYLYMQNMGIREAFLVPIPTHKSRLYEYGFSQTLLLAKEIERLSKGHCTTKQNLVYRHERDIQKHKDKTERLRITKNTFKVLRPEELTGRDVIVLDDVITTGATCLSALQALKAAGVSRILAVAFAH